MLHTPLRSFLLQTRDLSYPPPNPTPKLFICTPAPAPLASPFRVPLFVKASASSLVFSFSHIVVPCLQLWPVPRPSQGLFFLISSSWEGHSHFSSDPARLHVDCRPHCSYCGPSRTQCAGEMKWWCLVGGGGARAQNWELTGLRIRHDFAHFYLPVRRGG